jgi:ubiquinone/menaquinone biosynthesis C-methylase UbiE
MGQCHRNGHSDSWWVSPLTSQFCLFDLFHRHQRFPWDILPEGTIVCDVGGGVGNISLKLAKRYPTLRLVLQDLPQPLNTAEKKIWPERCPEAISENRIEFVPLDFLKGTPKEGCDIYYVSFLNHR